MRPLDSPHFDSNGDCRYCNWHSSKHTFLQGNVKCPALSETERIANAIEEYGVGRLFLVSELVSKLEGVSRDNIDQTLHRLHKAGELTRAQRGMYYLSPRKKES